MRLIAPARYCYLAKTAGLSFVPLGSPERFTMRGYVVALGAFMPAVMGPFRRVGL